MSSIRIESRPGIYFKSLPVCPVCELGYIGQSGICTNCGRSVPQGGSDGYGRMGKAVADMRLPACCQSQGNAGGNKSELC